MKALVQRVTSASVEIEGRIVGAIGPGLLVFLCAMQGDTEGEADKLLTKVLKLRIFADAQGRMNLSVQDIAGGLLIVSQFTLAADTRGGNRPSFSLAASPADGHRLYEHFVCTAKAQYPEVACGEFAAHMRVQLVNDGPVTVPIEVAPAG
ncbi:MAG TPA: D-aminoacyl-tRNA deacylase [Burkholderiaceae bacterium]|nr:D-aminoacyl-tRNA deacylase [Burkholderiaceae bacterium]